MMTTATTTEIKNDLRSGIVQITYEKKDGTINTRKATLNMELIPEKDHPQGTGTPCKDEGYIKYFDVTKQEWRMFHLDRLKEIQVLFKLQTVNEEYEYHTLKFKKLNFEAVKRVAEEVFQAKQLLTTLHLKTALRKEGYWAEQVKVSELMNKVCEEENTWDYLQQAEDDFRLYFPKEEKVAA